MIASIIVPTYNRGSQILLTLDALSRQSISDDIEILVVDDGSTDSTRDVVQKYLQENPIIPAQYFYYPVNRGKASVCNDAIKIARGALIIFTDDDCVPAPDWIEMHIKRHSESASPISVLGSVSFPFEWLGNSNFVQYVNSRYVGNRSANSVGGSLDDLPPNFFGGLNVSVPREQLIKVNFFNENIGRGQDVELGFRLWKTGIKLVYDPRPFVVHYSPEMSSMQEWLTKFVKFYRLSVPSFEKLHPEYIRMFGHWLLEAPDFFSDPVKRTLQKLIIRVVFRKCIAKPLQIFLDKTDHLTLCYLPLVFKYVIITACLDNVKIREQANRK